MSGKHRKPAKSHVRGRRAGFIGVACSGALLLSALGVVESGGFGVSPVPPANSEVALPKFPQQGALVFGDLRLERVADDDNPLPETDGGSTTNDDSPTTQGNDSPPKETEEVIDTTTEVDVPEITSEDLPTPTEVETTEPVPTTTAEETTTPSVPVDCN